MLATAVKRAAFAAAIALSLTVVGCGASPSGPSRASARGSDPPQCPRAWKAGWQTLANRIRAPVYCPTWMPQPLDGKIAAPFAPLAYVERNRSYLVSFIWAEPNPSATYEVHVNFRGYPGRTAIPICEDTIVDGAKTLHPKIPCFSDSHGQRRLGGITATVYTANQGTDTWHILYAWRHGGSLYAVSEHVITPNTYAHVTQNLDRIVRSLAVVPPSR